MSTDMTPAIANGIQDLMAENASLKSRIAELEEERRRILDATHELINAIVWSHDDADYKAPEQFTKAYAYGRYLNRLLQIAMAVNDLHPLPTPPTK